MSDFSQLCCATHIWGRNNNNNNNNNNDNSNNNLCLQMLKERNSVGKWKHWMCSKNDMRSNSEEVAMAGQPHNAEAAPARRVDREPNLPERNFSKEDCDNPQPMDQHKRRVPHDIYRHCPFALHHSLMVSCNQSCTNYFQFSL